jgi:peptidoglycan/LPS O-acetylase OafA/YrhL
MEDFGLCRNVSTDGYCAIGMGYCGVCAKCISTITEVPSPLLSLNHYRILSNKLTHFHHAAGKYGTCTFSGICTPVTYPLIGTSTQLTTHCLFYAYFRPMNKGIPGTDILKTKQHFLILDGLRGTAALGVVIFHFMEWVFSDYSQNFIGHGFLAVDFFFCLSGFVIGYAYDNRIEKMGMKEFFKSRLIRLHPLVILGSVLGLLGFLLDPFLAPAATYSISKLILLFLCSILLIPMPVMEERAFNLFGLNAPSWSLFWEYVANIIYAFILYRLSRRYLTVLTIIAAVVLCFVSYRAGNLLGGWAGDNFWDGGARVAYSFSAGLLLYRSNWIIKNKLGFPVLAMLLFAAFLMPGSRWNWLTEPLIVLFYFPLLVSLGAGSTLTPGMKKLCSFSGDISYPLYMTHYAAIWLFGHYYTSHKPATGELAITIIVGVLFLIGIAYLAMILYDLPVRRWLNKKRQQSTVLVISG